jgi:hypothetical protein
MPLSGTGDILGLALMADADAVAAAAASQGKSADREDLFRRWGRSIVAHIVEHGALAVVGTATGVTAGPAAVPVTGNIV